MTNYKFDFTLDAIDVENLFDLFTQEISTMNMHIMDEMAEANRPEYISWYKQRIEYMNELLQKLTNTPIDENNTNSSIMLNNSTYLTENLTMNPKIQELLDNSTTKIPNHYLNSDGEVVVPCYDTQIDMGKFAILVIQECFDAIYDTELTIIQSPAVEDIIKNIFKKFGKNI